MIPPLGFSSTVSNPVRRFRGESGARLEATAAGPPAPHVMDVAIVWRLLCPLEAIYCSTKKALGDSHRGGWPTPLASIASLAAWRISAVTWSLDSRMTVG